MLLLPDATVQLVVLPSRLFSITLIVAQQSGVDFSPRLLAIMLFLTVSFVFGVKLNTYTPPALKPRLFTIVELMIVADSVDCSEYV